MTGEPIEIRIEDGKIIIEHNGFKDGACLKETEEFIKDMEKYNYLALEGWTLLRFQPNEKHKKETIEKIKETNKLKNKENPNRKKDISDKAKSTFNKRYGVDNILLKEINQEKARISLYEKNLVLSSKGQRYLHSLLGGEFNYPVGDLIFEAGGVKIGFEICEDAWIANRPGRSLYLQGVDIILNPTASHFAFFKTQTRERLVQDGSRAFGVAYIYA